MADQFPLLAAAAAVQLLSMHATTAACERTWSAFGQLFTKTRNQLLVERGKKIVQIKANSAAGLKGVDEEILLSEMDLVD